MSNPIDPVDALTAPLGHVLDIGPMGTAPSSPGIENSILETIRHFGVTPDTVEYHPAEVPDRGIVLGVLSERWVAARSEQDRISVDLRLAGDGKRRSFGRIVGFTRPRPSGSTPPGVVPELLEPGLVGSFRPGLTHELQITVDATDITDHLGPAVLATPSLVRHMEMCSAATIRPNLIDGFGTVGVHNDIAHSGAAYPGEIIHYRSSVAGVDRRRIVLRVDAMVEDRLVGSGWHQSYVVDLDSWRRTAKRRGGGRDISA